jgi:hypothetical protein
MAGVDPLLPRDLRVIVSRLNDPAFPDVEKAVIRTLLWALANPAGEPPTPSEAEAIRNGTHALPHDQEGH